MEPKQRAAEEALQFIADGMVVGLGTGSTADFFLRALADAIKAGRFKDVRGVPTSRQSDLRAQQLGIPLTTIGASIHTDVTVDGADEIAPNLDLIKGLGGALLREKIVAQDTRKLVIIADSGKVVAKLGTKAMLPVEVVTFANEAQVPFFRSCGGAPALRRSGDGSPFLTDNGNLIYDLRFENGIDDAHGLERALKSRAGIVETGLFLGVAQVAIVASDKGIERFERRRSV
jgi:ribose 5-phosphate isomerase A